MSELMSIISVIVFIVFILLNLLIMLFVSSYMAAAIMVLIPILLVIILPDLVTGFFCYEQVSFLDGMVTINNLHILLFIWSTLLGVIIYTEVVSWYITGRSLNLKFGKTKKATEEKVTDKSKENQGVIQQNKPLERLRKKFKNFFGGK
jgi:hypothetical protein